MGAEIIKIYEYDVICMPPLFSIRNTAEIIDNWLQANGLCYVYDGRNVWLRQKVDDMVFSCEHSGRYSKTVPQIEVRLRFRREVWAQNTPEGLYVA
mmetsp:Transcript_8959/g.15396  ORF Transcript_8959/g.15396 Transcript_8959/m.15396 type:complete len:96 (-) Transcript_8959:461-748(-)